MKRQPNSTRASTGEGRRAVNTEAASLFNDTNTLLDLALVRLL